MLHKSILPIILLLTLCSCVVSFGMNTDKENEILNQTTNYDTNKDICNEKAQYMVISIENKKYKIDKKPANALRYILLFAPGLITGIGGYDNKWEPLKWGLYLFRSNLWLAYGLNKHICDSNYIDVDLHILGINFLSFLENIIIKYAIKCDYIAIVNKYDVGIPKANDNYFYIVYFMWLFVVHTFQFLDFEIKVFKYWSISLNFTVVVLNLFYIIRHKIITYVTK